MHKPAPKNWGEKMELKKIQYFLKIVEKGSLSRAAESLYLTQPTLSRFLARLEEEVGTKLFYRGRDNALSLTDSGKIYLETARKIDMLWREMEGELAEGKRPRQEILLGIDADSLYPFVTACADQVTACFPGVSVQILRQNAYEIQQYVAEGSLDIGMTAYEEEDERLTYLPNRRAEVNLIVSWNNPIRLHKRTEEGRIDLRTLPPHLPFVLIRENTILRQLENRYLEQYHYEPAILRTYNQHRSAVEIISASNELIGFCPCNYVSDRVAYLPLEMPFYYKSGICVLRNGEQTQAQRFLVSLLKHQPATNSLD